MQGQISPRAAARMGGSQSPGGAHRRREAAQPYDHLVKLLLLGDSAVGKSSLLLRFCEDKFRSAHVLTIGVDFKTKIVNAYDEKVKLQIWDTAGQERFRNITPVYFRSAMGVVLVYDITKMDTFENVKFWIKNLNDYSSSDIVKVLVGNKVDLEENRTVTAAQGAALAREFNMPFFETSAKTNTQIDQAFSEMAHRVRRFQIAAATVVVPVTPDIKLDPEEVEPSGSSGCCAGWNGKKQRPSQLSSASHSGQNLTKAPQQQQPQRSPKSPDGRRHSKQIPRVN